MSLTRRPTKSEIQSNFDAALKRAIDIGMGPPSDQGFDEYTIDALMEVARSYPKFNSALIERAKAELVAQFDGTHQRRAMMELEAALAAVRE